MACFLMVLFTPINPIRVIICQAHYIKLSKLSSLYLSWKQLFCFSLGVEKINHGMGKTKGWRIDGSVQWAKTVILWTFSHKLGKEIWLRAFSKHIIKTNTKNDQVWSKNWWFFPVVPHIRSRNTWLLLGNVESLTKY